MGPRNTAAPRPECRRRARGPGGAGDTDSVGLACARSSGPDPLPARPPARGFSAGSVSPPSSGTDGAGARRGRGGPAPRRPAPAGPGPPAGRPPALWAAGSACTRPPPRLAPWPLALARRAGGRGPGRRGGGPLTRGGHGARPAAARRAPHCAGRHPARTGSRRLFLSGSGPPLSGVIPEGGQAGRVRPASGSGAGIHGIRGASGDVRVRGPGFPSDLRPRAPPLAPLVHHPESHFSVCGVGLGLVGWFGEEAHGRPARRPSGAGEALGPVPRIRPPDPPPISPPISSITSACRDPAEARPPKKSPRCGARREEGAGRGGAQRRP